MPSADEKSRELRRFENDFPARWWNAMKARLGAGTDAQLEAALEPLLYPSDAMKQEARNFWNTATAFVDAARVLLRDELSSLSQLEADRLGDLVSLNARRKSIVFRTIGRRLGVLPESVGLASPSAAAASTLVDELAKLRGREWGWIAVAVLAALGLAYALGGKNS